MAAWPRSPPGGIHCEQYPRGGSARVVVIQLVHDAVEPTVSDELQRHVPLGVAARSRRAVRQVDMWHTGPVSKRRATCMLKLRWVSCVVRRPAAHDLTPLTSLRSLCCPSAGLMTPSVLDGVWTRPRKASRQLMWATWGWCPRDVPHGTTLSQLTPRTR